MARATPEFLRPVEDGAPPLPKDAVAAFPGEWMAPWLRARRKLDGAGYGAALCRDYDMASIAVARQVGPGPAVDMADTVSAVAIKAGRAAAAALCAAAPVAAARTADPARFRSWLSLLQRFAAMAPESTVPVLARMGELLDRLNPAQLEAWLLAGVRQGGADAERRRAFFAFEAPDAARLLEREAGGTGFFDCEPRMRAFLTALWGVTPTLREAPPGRHDGARRRPSFAEGVVQMPNHMPGFRDASAEALFRAALAHVGAHITHSGPRFEVGQLKPLQIAVVSLIEDARVEALAMHAMPGLRRLWLPFHVAEATGALTAESRFARLSRALIDPDFEDIDGWVRKGRDLFHAARDRWDDPGLSRAIGNLLGNDLGQLRVQFNARTYSVQPPYRDDNQGLWAFPDDAPPQDAAEMMLEAARVTRPETPDAADRERPDTEPAAPDARLRPAAPDAETLMPVARYPEYDYEARVERPDWATVVACTATDGSPRYVADTLARHRGLVDRLEALVTATKVGRAERQRGLEEGETLDLDACIGALAALRSGDTPDVRVYQTVAPRRRDLSVSVLLDISASTADPVDGAGPRVIDVLRDATLVLAKALERLGDPFGIAAFASDGRDAVRYTTVKAFNAPFDARAGAALAGLAPGYSTRLGAALRHAGADIATRPTHRRLILLVTDGEPSDIDCPDPRYLVEDARRAVQTLHARGIDVFCVGLGAGNEAARTRVFGARRVVQIASVADLPEKLAILYLRLTA